MGNCLYRSLPTTGPLGSLRKRTGRNASEPKCSTVKSTLPPGEGYGSVEPFSRWRRLVQSIAGQETLLAAGRIGNQEQETRVVPEDSGIGMDWLPGVPGMACAESILVNHGRSGQDPRLWHGNHPSGVRCRDRKSERFVVMMTVGTTQPRKSEGTALSQCLLEEQRSV
jgi:hypothetical protein